MICIEAFLSSIHCLTELYNAGDEGVEYPEDSRDWRGQLMTFICLSPSRAIDIDFKLPEKVLDLSNMQQSGQFGG